MLRQSFTLLRRGQPNPPRGELFWRVPLAHRPFQGGQQHFQHILLQRANDAAARERASSSGAAAAAAQSSSRNNKQNSKNDNNNSDMNNVDPRIQFPEQNVLFSRNNRNRRALAADDDELISDLKQNDGFVQQRSFNERDFYERVQVEMKHQIANQKNSTLETESKLMNAAMMEEKEREIANQTPRTITDESDFHAAHGFSIIKKKSSNYNREFVEGNPQYANLDLWSEMPIYPPGTYFLYLIARRRNVYAVIYDRDGKRLLPTYSVGNRGMKESDRGFKGEGTAENAHQVTSQYLSDVLPKIKEIEANAGRPITKEKKVDLVVRVLGFYNGRQGAIRAVTDHADVYQVKYLEDVTPFPLNGPRMPRAQVKSIMSSK